MRYRPHKLYIFLITITSRVDLAMSVCPSVHINAEISETIKARKVGLSMSVYNLYSAYIFKDFGKKQNRTWF